MDKNALKEHCIRVLTDKAKSLSQAVHEAQAAVNSESKSSAGDKHETGREMAKQEVDKLGAQLMQAESRLEVVQKMTAVKNPEQTGIGSLIYTNHGIFYLLTALGKIEFNGEHIIVLSAQSPLGVHLLGKKQQDQFEFMEKTYRVESYC